MKEPIGQAGAAGGEGVPGHPPPAARVLVVEDQQKMSDFVRQGLVDEGFTVTVAGNGEEAGVALQASGFDAIVLDIMLPGKDGLTLLREWRAARITTPVLLLSARGRVNERVDGLNAGADDYLPKPFVIAELVARIRAVSRRGLESRLTILQVGDLQLDTVTRRARRGTVVIDLTVREYRLLEFLMRSADRLCGRMLLLEKVWDYHFDPGTNLVEVYIKRVREKMDDPFSLKLLHTVRGLGYMIKTPQ
jgi:DNA-binding response OmpR family regulator